MAYSKDLTQYWARYTSDYSDGTCVSRSCKIV